MCQFHLQHLLMLVLVVQLPSLGLGMPASSPKDKNDQASSKAAGNNAKTPQKSSMHASLWPYWVAGLTGLGWTAHRAWQDRRPHVVDRWDYYNSINEVENELDDDAERYVNVMTECVQGKFDKIFPRKGFKLDDVFEDRKMTIAQHRRATWAIKECVEMTNERIATDKGQSSEHRTGSTAENEGKQTDWEHSKRPSKENNHFGFINAVGREILKAGDKVNMIPHGSLGGAKVLPGSLPVGKPLVY